MEAEVELQSDEREIMGGRIHWRPVVREAVEDNIDEVGVYGEGHNSLVFAIVFAKLLVSSRKMARSQVQSFASKKDQGLT